MERKKVTKKQGRPANSKQKSEDKPNYIWIFAKVVIEVFFIVAIFYAGHVWGPYIFNKDCPPIEVVERCYLNTNIGIIPIDGDRGEIKLNGYVNTSYGFIPEELYDILGGVNDDVK